MIRALVLGAGRVGHAIACDLAEDPNWKVTCADLAPRNLARLARQASIATVEADLSDPEVISRLVEPADIVVGAMPSFLGFAALERVLLAGRNYVDISFFEEDAFRLRDLAARSGATAVVDCGIAPGFDNMILGRMLEEMERVEKFTCYVGGLPRERSLPWEYKAPFAPNDVLNEYLRPARWVSGGEIITSKPLIDIEPIEIPGVGTLEAFLTDGLRSLLSTVDVPEMKEKTLRYPGHAAKIALLEASGLLSDQPLDFNGTSISPLELTSRVLLPCWELDPKEDEFTAFRVVIEGIALRDEDGESGDGESADGVSRADGQERERHTFDLLDCRDAATGFSSMARTTGFTCAATARAVAEGTFSQTGLFAPEQVGAHEPSYRRIVADLAERGIELRHLVEAL